MSFSHFLIVLHVLLVSQVVYLQQAATQKSSPTASSIRDIDFENFTYPLPKDLIDPIDRIKTFKLEKGKRPETRFANGMVNEMDISLAGKIKYGDVTGDDSEEAIVFMSILTGGTAMPGIIYVYTMQGNHLKMLWNLTTGDRAFGGYRNAYIKNGRLVIELFIPEGGQGNCCPIKYTRTVYEWQKNQFKPKQKQTFPIQ